MFASYFLVVIAVVLYLWTKETLFPKKKEKKSAEQELGDTLAKLLEKGIKVRIDSKD